MNIAICDDDSKFLSLAVKNVEEVLAKMKMMAGVHTYSRPEDLLEKYKKHEVDFDILLIDIEMGEMDGKTCVHELRKVNEHFKLLFVTSFEREVYSSFSLNARAFIPKRMFQRMIQVELTRVINEILEEQIEWMFFIVKDEFDENVRIKLSSAEILYFESTNRKIYMHTMQNQYILRRTGFEEIKKEFESFGFVEIHRLYIVNVKHVKRIHKDSFEMENGDVLLVSRRNYSRAVKAVEDTVLGNL